MIRTADFIYLPSCKSWSYVADLYGLYILSYTVVPIDNLIEVRCLFITTTAVRISDASFYQLVRICNN